MIDLKPFENIIKQLKAEGKYRVFNDILRERGKFPKSIWYGKYSIKEITNWCSNDYLGMGQHKVVIDAMHTALDQTGAGSGGTRNISGTSHYHVALERELAILHKKKSALLFSSAYVANEWSLIALSKIVPNIVFLSDSKNHASLIQGIRHSGAAKLIWQHNDMSDLEAKLEQVTATGGTPCIVFESVYSMDGDVSPIEHVCDLADKYDAMTYIVKKWISNIDNMRDNIKATGQSSRDFLPLWMRTAQEAGLVELDYRLAVPLVYCKPGTGQTIYENILNTGFDFTSINYDIDRYIIDTTTGKSQEQYIVFANYQFNV